MKNITVTPPTLAKFVVGICFLALSCAAIGREPLADQFAVAAPGDKNVTYPVRFADLDVSTMKGAKSLYSRIRYAAIIVCRNDLIWSKKDGDACMQRAIGSAVATVNSPLLSQYAQLRSRRDRAGLAQVAKSN